MRILYLTQYFPPEIGATQTRAFEMASGLSRAGHEVTLITEFPNHPTGIIPSDYKRKVFERSRQDGIQVIRVWVKASPKKTFSSRLIFYLSYMVMAAFAGLLLARGKFDAVYASSPPLFVGGAALAISYLRRMPLFFEVRDLWPESAVQLGVLSDKRAIRWSTRLEEVCYRRSQHVIVVTNGIKRRLIDRGFADKKVTVIPNGANTDLYFAQPADPHLQQQLGIDPDDLVVIYVGLVGLIHGLETVIYAAELLLQHRDVRFLFVGDGPRKNAIVKLSNEKSLSNVHFHDAVPERQLPGYIALAQVGLHVQRRLEVSRTALPVKVFSYMACELPIIIAAEGEGAQLVDDAQAGIIVPAEDPSKLAKAILSLKSDPVKRQEYGQNGRRFVEANYSRQSQAAELTKLLERTVGTTGT